ncbi:hypothetical protein SAMN04488074_103162 [Lentzea albidocapillata subsp. violacea]|uniref:Helix-hairpin-helix domain-containing protein n=1 Tax=Lentzea albidocapillata subsp. violacea TaxID=128104 RepID=A0A1G8WEI9_9PSEU|nr:hypothetical protein SAMN04488074_103162 [Lentzea albidocapillata subsp. violacea]
MGVEGRAGALVSEQPGSEFPRAIGKVANRELVANGYTTYDSLTEVSARTLLQIHGIGPKAVRILGEELAAQGKAYAAD